MKTEVYIDGVNLDFEDSEGNSTLGDLVGVVGQELRGAGRYVDGLCADGEPLADWREGQELARPLSALGEVNLLTASFDDVAARGINTLREYSAVIKQNIAACAGSLRKGGPAGEEFSSVVDGVIEVVKTIEVLARGSGAYGTELFSSDPAPCCASLLGSLDALKDAGASMDSVMMADILEYELAGALDEVRRMTAVPAA
ncbi:MAG: hypothetical protein BMS9Abin24_111 [Thermodesulfobacteriota bacterium]|nr:MAG: hypothetical protein BMS9Abin24_111 [Thermodesulfobacteriota bacterium]